MLATQTDVAARHDLVERLISARERTDQLFRFVKAGSLHERPIPERDRIIFYVGHLESFDWNLLRERLLGLKSFHPGFDRLFAFGIDPVGGGLPDDQPSDWPPEEEIRQYVRRIRQVLDENLLSANDERHSGEFPFRTLLNVAIEHRLMHAETLAYMLHQLPLERKIKQPSATFPAKLPLKPRMIDILAGRATLDLRRD